MLITITCPVCERPSQIDDAHRGKRLRCPYPDCRKPFQLLADGQAYAVAESGGREETPRHAGPSPIEQLAGLQDQPRMQSGREGMAPAEPAVASAGPRELDWRTAAPPIRDWRTEPPPIRAAPARTESPSIEQSDVERASLPEASEAATAPAANPYQSYRRKSPGMLRGLLLTIILIGVVGCAFGGFWYWRQSQRGEALLAEKAQQEYDKGFYDRAEASFRELVEKHPGSEKIIHYRFMAQWCRVKGLAESAAPDVPHAVGLMSEFVKEFDGKPSFQEFAGTITETLLQLGTQGASQAARKGDRRILDAGRDAWKMARALATDDTETLAKLENVERNLLEAGRAVVLAEAKAELMAEFDRIQQTEKPGDIEKAQQRHAAAVKMHPALARDADLLGRLAELRRLEPTWIRYIDAVETPPFSPDAAAEPALWICPRSGRAADPPLRSDAGCLVVIVRGVAYGVASSDGKVSWARRLGIDSPTAARLLPPLQSGAAPLAIVVSSLEKRLLVLDAATGRTRWALPLPGECPAGPILHGRRIFVPTVEGLHRDNGRLLEVVLSLDPASGEVRGELRGSFAVGQPLSTAGTYDPATDRLYLPGEHRRLYVFDMSRRTCKAVLYTDHGPGQLLGPPVAADSTLILPEAQQLDRMKLRVFDLDAAGDQPVVEYSIPGWSGFAPYFDGRTLAVATDQGKLALFDYDRGSPRRLLPLAPPLPLLDSDGKPAGDPSGRSSEAAQPQIVRAELNDWWVLWKGKIRHYRFDVYRQELVAVGEGEAALGNPAGEPQTSEDERLLFLTVQPSQRPQVLLCCVVGGGRQLVWQTQLGIDWACDPLRLGNRLYAFDASGGIVALDPAQCVELDAPRVVGEWFRPGRGDAVGVRVIVAEDQSFAVQLVFTAGGELMLLRKIDADGKVFEQVFRLTAALSGEPALTRRAIVLPCRDGLLYEFPLDDRPEPAARITWREPSAGSNARGYAVALGDEVMIVSNGGQKLQRWVWQPDKKLWQKDDAAVTEALPSPIAAPILPLPLPTGKAALCVGDDKGSLVLMDPELLRSTSSPKEWAFGGRITTGPYRLDGRVAVVLDGRRLIWFDPLSPSFQTCSYAVPRLGIVGRPVLFGERILLTDAGGVLTLVDLQAADPKPIPCPPLAPAAAAVPVGARRLLVPCLDGTALLVDLVP